ncbi:hypothetical protein NLX83_37360 [Allokutzneria sp. A3M-2-11 16]|uniref:hypothetical protein n=1 Tax=Allokutzneria sp. A3M-2-11 16 TaxID=2962043 RepID=UPI0020B8EF69|nr:hypothetical protein [Allokutzneria sp. A3M-2-11 16]MCP3804950.1 hypothetical protein [Allokutzneria sp. A3M-2-11 16]
MRLPYEPDDDITAEELIGIELRSPDVTRWRAMITDERVIQTHRVLKSIYRTIEITFAHRNAELREVRAAFQAGVITERQRCDAVAEYERWKGRALTFRSRVVLRLEQIVHRVRQLTGDLTFEGAQSALLRLATAVADHQITVERQGEATAADRLLWARLTTLTYPVTRNEDVAPVALADAVSQARPPQK